jgi:hypothetical protein
MTKPGHLEFNFIYVVQSLDADELQTGTALDHFAVKPRIETMNREGLCIGAEVVDVATTKDLFGFLTRVQTEVESGARFPILHFEIHGASDKQGLVLRSGDFVEWTLLLEPLTRINRAMGNNLLITLAVCHGVYLGTILSAARPAAYWAVIGPSGTECPLVLFPAFEAFYAKLLDAMDGRKALEALLHAARAASGAQSFEVIHAEPVFAKAFRRYVEEHCNPEAVAQRIAKGVSEAKARAVAVGKVVPEQVWADLAAKGAQRMADARSAFEELRRRFFMIDVWPENDERFPITYEQVVGGVSGEAG